MPYANNQGVKIYYEVEGEGSPLMLMHGMGGSMEEWRMNGYARELGKSHRLILVDARCFGKSDKPPDPKAYGFERRVGDLVAVLDDLNISQAAYFGYSMGGKLGYRIPVYAPRRFSRLVLGGMGYPITGKEEWEDPIGKQTEADLEEALKQAPENPMAWVANAREKRTGAPIPPARRATLLANDARAFLIYIRESRRMVSPKAEDVLTKFALPCLIFAGEKDPWFPVARASAALIPDSRFVALPGLDHGQVMQHSELVLPLIREFLSRESKT